MLINARSLCPSGSDQIWIDSLPPLSTGLTVVSQPPCLTYTSGYLTVFVIAFILFIVLVRQNDLVMSLCGTQRTRMHLEKTWKCFVEALDVREPPNVVSPTDVSVTIATTPLTPRLTDITTSLMSHSLPLNGRLRIARIVRPKAG